jgi:hypothetical protein
MSAFVELSKRKGYASACSNYVAHNIFLERRVLLLLLKPLNTQEAYVVSRFRDSRDAKRELNFLGVERRYDEINNLPDVETISARMTTLMKLDANATS